MIVRYSFALTLISLMIPGACKRDTPQPMPGTIPLKVWVVLSLGASDVYGSDQNQGCRLSGAEITSYITALMNNRHIFGANFRFAWDGSVTEARTSAVPLCFPPLPCPSRKADMQQAAEDLFLVQDLWAPNSINIYFGGWLSTDPSTNQMQIGFTADPGGKPNFPFIVINDRGWNEPSGAFVILADHILEHEMTHFLLRRSGVQPYNSTEHVPMGAANILTPFAPHLLHVPTSEQNEIRNRILSGNWDNP
jgi:hypothetical protein